MRTVVRFRRRALSLFALAALAIGSTGCNGVAPSAAASVNGHAVSRSDVVQLLESRNKLPGQTSLKGAGKGTFTSQAFADTLDRLVYMEILHQELDRRHLTITSAQRDQSKAALDQSAGAAQAKKLPTKLRDFVIEFGAAQVALQAAVAPKVDPAERQKQVAAAYEQQKGALTNACLSVIVTPTRQAADAAAARVKKGEKFADVARQVSVDQTKDQGGAAGCQPLSQQPQIIAGDLAKAKQGALLGPYDLQGSFGLVELTQLQVPTLDQARGQIEAALPPPGQAQLQSLVTRLIAKAKVDVNPRFGRWNAKGGKVDPPAGAPAAATTPATAPAGSGSPAGAPAPGGSPAPG